MVTDDDILEKEDMYILTRMKEFASNEEVVTFAAAKQLLILIERAVSYELFFSIVYYSDVLLIATRRRCAYQDHKHRASCTSSAHHAEDIEEA